MGKIESFFWGHTTRISKVLPEKSPFHKCWAPRWEAQGKEKRFSGSAFFYAAENRKFSKIQQNSDSTWRRKVMWAVEDQRRVMAPEKIPGHRGVLCVERSLGTEKSWGYREIWGYRRELGLHVSKAKFRNYFKKCCDNFSTYSWYFMFLKLSIFINSVHLDIFVEPKYLALLKESQSEIRIIGWSQEEDVFHSMEVDHSLSFLFIL